MEIVVGKKYQHTTTGSIGTVTAIGITSILIVFKGNREILWLKDDVERYLVPYVKSIEVGDWVLYLGCSAIVRHILDGRVWIDFVNGEGKIVKIGSLKQKED